MDFMDLIGSMVGGGMTNSGGGLQDLIGSFMGGSNKNKAAAAGLGALLGALTGNSSSTTLNSVGGGLMGLLGMMAYNALTKGGTPETSRANQIAQNITQTSNNNDAEIILTAMLDAAKSDGQIDSNEIERIMGKIKATGAGQEGVNCIISKLQSPMETDKILRAVRGRPELAAEVYAASLMAIDVDTEAERRYLKVLSQKMGLNDSVTKEIESMLRR